MNKTYFKRLEKLADFLDKLPREKFNFADLVSEIDKKGCGTVCCAIGWTPKVLPHLVKFTGDSIKLRSSSYIYIYILWSLFQKFCLELQGENTTNYLNQERRNVRSEKIPPQRWWQSK
jgi:hypothetical protein